MAKVFISGGAGFIGSHIAEAHLASGFDVVVVDNLSTGKRENLPLGVTFYEGDITSLSDMEEIFFGKSQIMSIITLPRSICVAPQKSPF